MNLNELAELLHGKPRNLHFIGIGGAGMSGVAKLCLALGHRVTGSDLAINEEVQRLRRRGVLVEEGHRKENLRSADLVIHSSAIKRDNPEMTEAERLNLFIVRRAQALAALMGRKTGIAISGTHGKTTTSAMIAHILRASNRAPTFCIGALIPVLGGNAESGRGSHFVAEVDESDGTLTMFESPYAVITNVEEEHLDHFADLPAILDSFGQFAEHAKETLFYCADDAHAGRVSARARRAVSYGFNPAADFRVANWRRDGFGSGAEIFSQNERLGSIHLVLPGSQNVVNACGAVAVGVVLGI